MVTNPLDSHVPVSTSTAKFRGEIRVFLVELFGNLLYGTVERVFSFFHIARSRPIHTAILIWYHGPREISTRVVLEGSK